MAVSEALGEARRARKKPRLLKSQAVLAEAHAIKPAIPHQVRRQKGQQRRQPHQPARPSPKAGAKPSATSSTYDLWEGSGPAPDGQLALSDSLNLEQNSSGGRYPGAEPSLQHASVPQAVLECLIAYLDQPRM